jgi:hypothetical protein
MEAGDLVLCVCDFEKFASNYEIEVNYPTPGKYYTIRKVTNISEENEGIVFLDEITNQKVPVAKYTRREIGFQGSCFVKIPNPDISELTNLLL